MLERIPTIPTAQEALDKAFHKAAKIVVEDPEKYHRMRKEMVQRIESVSETLQATLTRIVKAFPNLDRLRDYETEVMQILVGLDPLRKAIKRVDWGSQMVMDLRREHVDRARFLRTEEAFHELLKRHYGRVSSVLYKIDGALTFLREARDRMRFLPEVRPDHFTVVVAGFPNVGKTSLLRAWTASRAEVNSYPFTTKHAEVGHFEVRDAQGVPARVQVVDTPGLLDRPDEQRNPIERQAVAALRYAADAVLFLLDPTETSGYSLAEQEHLLEQVQREMAGLPFLVVEAKADVAQAPTDRLKISTHTGAGLEELKARIMALLPTQEPELEADPLEAWKRGERRA